MPAEAAGHGSDLSCYDKEHGRVADHNRGRFFTFVSVVVAYSVAVPCPTVSMFASYLADLDALDALRGADDQSGRHTDLFRVVLYLLLHPIR